MGVARALLAIGAGMFGLMAVGGCAGRPPGVPAPRPGISSGYELARHLLECVRAGRWDEAYSCMEGADRGSGSPDDLQEAYRVMVSMYGEPERFDYKGEAFGHTSYPDGSSAPINRYWFAAPTTDHPTGVYAIVDVVRDDKGPAVSVFSLVTFPGEVPDYLR